MAALISSACYPLIHKIELPKKQITAKEGISVLISNNARCLVPTKDFPKANVGMMWACNWHDTTEITGASSNRAAVAK